MFGLGVFSMENPHCGFVMLRSTEAFSITAGTGQPSTGMISRAELARADPRALSAYLSGLIPRNRANLLWIFDRFLGLRDFGEICMKARAFFLKKT